MLSKFPPHFLPVFCLLFSSSMWGILWYPLRLLDEAGLGGLWATLVIYGAASLVGVWIMRAQWRDLLLHPGIMLLMVLSQAWCNVAFILAVLDGQVVRVILLFYLSPVWAILLGWMILGERLDRMGGLTLVMALIGAMVMLWDPSMGIPWPRDTADWLAISSGVGFALANVLIRKLQDVPVAVKTASTWFGVTIVVLLMIVSQGFELPNTSLEIVSYAVILGFFGIVSMTLAVLYGVTHMPISRSAVIMLFEVVVGAVSSLILTDEVMQRVEWIGGGLIVLAAYLSTRSHLNEQKLQSQQTVTCQRTGE